MPSDIQKLIVPAELGKMFELYRVPGFYVHIQGSENVWKINLPFKTGLLRPYRNGSDFIQGFLIYGDVRDRNPKLLNSTGLMYGANPIPFNPYLEKAA